MTDLVSELQRQVNDRDALLRKIFAMFDITTEKTQLEINVMQEIKSLVNVNE